MSIQVVYVTCASKKDAKILAKELLQKRLIACANIYPIESLYQWNGTLNDEKEYVLWAKTLQNLIPTVEKNIIQSHPYEIPCIVNFSVNSSDDYLNWVKAQLL